MAFFWNLQQYRYYVLFCNEASRKLKTKMAFRYSSLPDAWIQKLWGCNSVKVAISWNESNVMTPAFFPESAWLFATIPFQIWNPGQVSKPGFGPALSAIHDDVFTYIISYSHAGWYCLCTQEKRYYINKKVISSWQKMLYLYKWYSMPFSFSLTI